MNKHRFANLLAATAASILLLSTAPSARAQSAQPEVQTTTPPPRPQRPQAVVQIPESGAPQMHAPAVKAQADPWANDFAGLDYSDEQKTQIAKIRQDAASRKQAVTKDDKLSAEQKDAMLTGYTRLEYSSIYRVLTPEQRRQVGMKIRARRLAEHQAQTQKK